MTSLDSLNFPIDLERLTEDPIPKQELGDQVENHISAEKVFSDKTPVYEKLINDLYHSGFSDGREKGKEVQKKWQTLQQTIEDNSKNSSFVTKYFAFLKEILPHQSIVDRLNSVEIPQLRTEVSQTTPNFDDIQVLSVKTLTLLDLIKFISHRFKTNELAPQIHKYKTECCDLIGGEQTARFLTPKITHLETTIEEALNSICDLDTLVKSWLKYHLVDRRAKLETNWAKENQPKIPQLQKQKLFELQNWGEGLKQNWIGENNSPEQLQSYPQELSSQVVSALQDTENIIDSLLTDVSESLENSNSKNESENAKNASKTFEQKLLDLETELGAIHPGDSLVNNNKQLAYASGLPSLLTELEREIRERNPESSHLENVSY